MSAKLTFPDIDTARKFYFDKFDTESKSTLKSLSLDRESLEKLTIKELDEKNKFLDDLLDDENFLNSKNYEYTNRRDFVIESNREGFSGFRFSLKSNLIAVKNYIRGRILELEQKSKVASIEDLVKNLPENALKDDLLKEIDELKIKKEELQKQQLKYQENYSTQIEYDKHKADIFKEKTDILLKFLDRESVASIVGSFLLLIIGICLLVVMFRHEEPLKIIESAFLLILGYFFGHSKNNK